MLKLQQVVLQQQVHIIVQLVMVSFLMQQKQVIVKSVLSTHGKLLMQLLQELFLHLDHALPVQQEQQL